MLQNRSAQQCFSFGLICYGDGHLWLKNWHQAVRGDLRADCKLLIHHLINTLAISRMDDRPHFCSKHTKACSAFQKWCQIWDWFKELHILSCVEQAFVDLQKRHNSTVLPEIAWGRFAGEFTAHRVLK